MKEERLIDELGDEFEVALLRSAELDEPVPQAVTRAAAAVGASIGVLAATSGGSGAASLGPAAATSSTSFGSKVTAFLAFTKWVGIGAVGGLTTLGTIDYVTRTASSPRDAAPSTAAPAAQNLVARAATDRHGTEPAGGAALSANAAVSNDRILSRVPAMNATNTPMPAGISGRASSRSVASDVGGTQPPATGARIATPPKEPQDAPAVDTSRNSLSAELAILESARQFLAAQDPRAVLSELDRYDRTRRSGVLDSEAMLLRIEALIQSSDRARAAELAERYLANHPESPHAQRLRAIAAGGRP